MTDQTKYVVEIAEQILREMWGRVDAASIS